MIATRIGALTPRARAIRRLAGMHSSAQLQVAPVDASTGIAVRALRVRPGQSGYVGDPAFNLDRALADPSSEAMAVLLDDCVVGSYRLDFAPNAVIGRGMGAPSVGLRAFLLDASRQGQGYGARAAQAMCADLQVRHPERRLLILLVHCANRAGIATYRRAGFVDSGELFAGGHAGPQHLMVRSLSSSSACVGQSPDGPRPSRSQ